MENKSTLFVVGARGYIGGALLASADKAGSAIGTLSTGGNNLLPLRLDAPAEFDYGKIRPGDVVLLTAAISAPDICAREHSRAWAVNVTGTSSFIQSVIDRGARVVFFSSDTVYGEREDEFDETAATNPAGEYAEMKREVEERFSGNASFKAIRLSYVFSREDKFRRYLWPPPGSPWPDAIMRCIQPWASVSPEPVTKGAYSQVTPALAPTNITPSWHQVTNAKFNGNSMKECSKSISRRLSDSNFLRRYFVGNGLDIGGKPDPLALYQEMFPLMTSVRTWDWEDGDAQFLNGVADCSLDFVHSSHCLEHLVDPKEGLLNWFRVVREGRYLIITVPDEDLYEQGVFPSTFNCDHKWTFTIFKTKSWSSRSMNVFDLVRGLGPAAEVVKIEQLSATYRFELPRFDQTLTPVAECGIEIIIRKRPQTEVEAGGRWQRATQQPEREIRLHMNQYKDDMARMKQSNQGVPPFENDSDL